MKEVMNTVGEAGHGKSVDSILGNQDSVRLSSASFKFAEDLSGDIPAPPSSLEAPPKNPAPKTPPSNRPLTQPQQPLGAPAPASSANAQEDPVAEQNYFRQVHRDFVSLKQKLGEPTEQLSFERFEVTLKKNKDTLKARYGCKSVKFNVYEKDGKASLKAVPVK